MSPVRILYVDDDDFIRELVEFALGMDPGFEVRTVDSGAAALALAAGPWRPDLFLLDVMMPLMDGPTTLGRLRELEGYGATPAAFVTARAQPQEQASLIAAGAAAVLTKPFDPMTLPQQVREVLASASTAA